MTFGKTHQELEQIRVRLDALEARTDPAPRLDAFNVRVDEVCERVTTLENAASDLWAKVSALDPAAALRTLQAALAGSPATRQLMLKISDDHVLQVALFGVASNMVELLRGTGFEEQKPLHPIWREWDTVKKRIAESASEYRDMAKFGRPAVGAGSEQLEDGKTR